MALKGFFYFRTQFSVNDETNAMKTNTYSLLSIYPNINKNNLIIYCILFSYYMLTYICRLYPGSIHTVPLLFPEKQCGAIIHF